MLIALLTACTATLPEETALPVEGPVVTVTAGEAHAEVFLAALVTADFMGEDAVPLPALLEASALAVDWNAATYNLIATDGFSAAEHGCDPVSRDTLSRGFIYPVSANVVWEDGAPVFSCHSVNGVVTLEARLP